VDGDSSQPSTASSARSRRDAALCLTTNQPSTTSARKNSLRRARGNTRVRRMIVTADLECGDFAGDERGATTDDFHAFYCLVESRRHDQQGKF
jgi:hypothetical protein